ncbi:hypothetical protein O6H91_07G019900 [Diphasiastrum complanatum]|uniref:Uncharacterized protein n=1 Tax=Diphasiastrum complanatum TaxID=34168 RepID=A0ACC2D2U5_DIPCM|nr:hypothetical protein O6H91_07G019900 [Diphasiastrum complanatum]
MSTTTTSAGGSGHSLAFRVMRLCRPACHVDLPLLVDPMDLSLGQDWIDTGTQSKLLDMPEHEHDHGDPLRSGQEADNWARRFELRDTVDALGLSGLLLLPQTFGSIYLGETFCSYISVGNHTTHLVRDVVIKAELQTERQRIILADNSKAPIDSIRAGGRYDFIIEHDIKELGSHTLVCMAVYTDFDGERKYLPQYFKFTTSNPISVRTKDITYLEACIENQTKSQLFMDHVRFDPTPPWTVAVLGVDNDANESTGPISKYMKQLKLIGANGGARHYLFQLRRPQTASVTLDGNNTLGKLELMWRTTLGEPGRLQTQQILGTPIPRKDVELQVMELPSHVTLEQPFLVRICVSNHTEHKVGPLKVSMSPMDDLGIMSTIVVNGLWIMIVPQLEPYASTDLTLNLVATAIGIQKIAGVQVADVQDGKVYDTLATTEVFVEA